MNYRIIIPMQGSGIDYPLCECQDLQAALAVMRALLDAAPTQYAWVRLELVPSMGA